MVCRRRNIGAEIPRRANKRGKQKGFFDCAAASLRESATPLRMTELFGSYLSSFFRVA